MKTSSPGGRGPRLARRPRLLKWQRPLPPRPRRAQHPGRPGPRRAPGRPDTRGARCGHRPPPAPVPPRTCRTLTQAGAAAGALAVRPGPGPGAGSGRRGINRGGEDSGASPEPRCVGPPPPSCRAPRGPLPAAARGSPATSPGSRAPRGSAASTWGSSPAAPSGNQLRKSLRSRSPSLGNASCRAAGRRARRAPRGSLRSPRGRQAGAAPDEWIHVAGSAGRGRWGRGSHPPLGGERSEVRGPSQGEVDGRRPGPRAGRGAPPIPHAGQWAPRPGSRGPGKSASPGQRSLPVLRPSGSTAKRLPQMITEKHVSLPSLRALGRAARPPPASLPAPAAQPCARAR